MVNHGLIDGLKEKHKKIERERGRKVRKNRNREIDWKLMFNSCDVRVMLDFVCIYISFFVEKCLKPQIYDPKISPNDLASVDSHWLNNEKGKINKTFPYFYLANSFGEHLG